MKEKVTSAEKDATTTGILNPVDPTSYFRMNLISKCDFISMQDRRKRKEGEGEEADVCSERFSPHYGHKTQGR